MKATNILFLLITIIFISLELLFVFFLPNLFLMLISLWIYVFVGLPFSLIGMDFRET
jgi:hypothetical protein